MIRALPERTEESDPDYRADLDAELQVAEWRVGRGRYATRWRPADVPDEAPAWWQGEDAASSEFLRGMGVVL